MYSAYLFDLDGTIYLGDELLPGAGTTVSTLRARGSRTIFLSNNPTRNRSQYVDKLNRLGIPVAVEDVVNSSFVMVQWLLRNAEKARLFVVGEEPLQDELRSAGFTLTTRAEEVDFVIASFDRTFAYRKLQIAFDAINAGARLVATNADRYCPVPGGGQPDAAAMIAAIEACTGTSCEVVVGKPSSIMVDTITRMVDLPPGRCIMVGDRLETDIQMGLNAGMDTALVLTGDATREKLAQSDITPTMVLDRIDGLL